MIAYIYDKYSLNIENKIDNVTSVQEGEINGDNKSVFGGGSEYIILQNPIDKNIGDVIDITGLEDERSYFLFGKDYWMQEKLQKANKVINQLQLSHDELKAKSEELQCFSLDLQYQIYTI